MMTKKRYFERMWEGEYYIFDSQIISEKEFDEKVEYEDYRAFEDSMSGDDVVDRLNELSEENEQLTKEFNSCSHNWALMYDEVKNKVEELSKENKELKELLGLISRADSFTKEESVKEILRNEIKAIDTVTDEFAGAWNDYCILSKFFREQYGEHWDNE